MEKNKQTPSIDSRRKGLAKRYKDALTAEATRLRLEQKDDNKLKFTVSSALLHLATKFPDEALKEGWKAAVKQAPPQHPKKADNLTDELVPERKVLLDESVSKFKTQVSQCLTLLRKELKPADKQQHPSHHGDAATLGNSKDNDTHVAAPSNDAALTLPPKFTRGVVTGLNNPGSANNCFLNSTLQVLAHASSFAPALFTAAHKALRVGPLTAATVAFIQHMHMERAPVGDQQHASFRRLSSPDRFGDTTQEDAAEYLQGLMAALSREDESAVQHAQFTLVRTNQCNACGRRNRAATEECVLHVPLPNAFNDADDLSVGDRVDVEDQGPGTVKYIANPVRGPEDVGIELDRKHFNAGDGKNGCGKRKFQCRRGHASYPNPLCVNFPTVANRSGKRGHGPVSALLKSMSRSAPIKDMHCEACCSANVGGCTMTNPDSPTKCHNPTTMGTQNVAVATAPRTLFLALSRMQSFTTALGQQTRKSQWQFKLEQEMSLEVAAADEPASVHQYRLVGVIMHAGHNVQSGHYYAYVRVGQQWYLINDAKVEKTNADTATTAKGTLTPYVLAYDRADTREDDVPRTNSATGAAPTRQTNDGASVPKTAAMTTPSEPAASPSKSAPTSTTGIATARMSSTDDPSEASNADGTLQQNNPTPVTNAVADPSASGQMPITIGDSSSDDEPAHVAPSASKIITGTVLNLADSLTVVGLVHMPVQEHFNQVIDMHTNVLHMCEQTDATANQLTTAAGQRTVSKKDTMSLWAKGAMTVTTSLAGSSAGQLGQVSRKSKRQRSTSLKRKAPQSHSEVVRFSKSAHGNYVNDVVVNTCLQLFREAFLDHDHAHIMNTQLMPFLQRWGKGEVTDKRVLRFGGTGLQHNLFARRHVCVPVNVADSHWWLAAFDLKDQKLLVLDSIEGGKEAMQDRRPYLDLLRRWVELNRKTYRHHLSVKHLPAANSVANFRLVAVHVPQQTDGRAGVGADCALHVLHSVLAIIVGRGANEVTHLEEHVHNSRLKILYLILTGVIVKEHWPALWA